VGREAQAFDLTLRDGRRLAGIVLRALARDVLEEREAAGVDVAEQRLIERHAIAAEHDETVAAAFLRDGKGDAGRLPGRALDFPRPAGSRLGQEWSAVAATPP